MKSAAYEPLSLFGFIDIIVRQKTIIIAISVVFCIAASAVIFLGKLLPSDSPLNLLPDYFEPTATLMIQEERSALTGKPDSGLIKSNFKIDDIGDREVAGSNIELADTILFAPSLVDKIIDEFGLIDHYRIKPPGSPEARIKARLAFKRSLFVSTRTVFLTAFCTMSYRDPESGFATRILTSTIELLKSRIEEITASGITSRLVAVEKALAKIGQARRRADASLSEFSAEHGIFDFSAEERQVVESAGDMAADILKKEIQIEQLKDILPEDSPAILYLKNDIDVKKRILDDFMYGSTEHSGVSAGELGELRRTSLRLRGEAVMQAKNHAVLEEQYERLKIYENDNSQILQVIEHPEYEKIAAGPNRPLYAFVAGIAGIFLAIAVGILREYMIGLLRGRAGDWLRPPRIRGRNEDTD